MEALAQLQAGFQQAAGLDATLVAYTLAALVAGLLATCLLRLYQGRYSYYSAPSPRIRPPYWALGNVEIVERCGAERRIGP
jgi:hypothetical protein